MSGNAPYRSIQEQYELIMQCRSSGLSDHQWCLEHDIKPSTFYNWVKRFRERACELPLPVKRNPLPMHPAFSQDVVKLEIIPDNEIASSINTPIPSSDNNAHCPIEIQTSNTLIRINNNADPQILQVIMNTIGGAIC